MAEPRATRGAEPPGAEPEPAASPARAAARSHAPPPAFGEDAPCDYCGTPSLKWRKCKLVCLSCGNINKSCADL